MRLSEVAEKVSGQLNGQDSEFTSISTDSRSLKKGQLFIALSGENFDAHDYLDQVREAGACAAIVSRLQSVDIPQIVVPDTLKALGLIGAAMAGQCQARFVGLTGSCGKTTTKEMIKLALSSMGETFATRGNLNNHIGVPLTLAEVSQHDDFAVIEMGASGQGEIEYTVSLTKPEVVLITNASAAHLEGFGSLENIVQAKGEIVRYAPSNAMVVLNHDDPNFMAWQHMLDGRSCSSFSRYSSSHADVRLIDKQQISDQGYVLTVNVKGKEVVVRLHVAGEHMVQNVLATLAVVDAMNLDVTLAAEALGGFQPVKGRFYPIKCNGFTVWDDTYNANPESVKAAIKTISEYTQPAWLVLGSMAELGGEADAAHKDIGLFAAEHGFDRVYAVGEYATSVIENQSFVGAAYNKADMDVLLNQLKKDVLTLADSGVQILVKGSRSAGMERVVQALVEISNSKNN